MVGGGKDREEMREILFKAKRFDNGEWVQGNLFIEENRAEITRSTCNGVGIEGVAVDKDTICQYTGLTDKNGNKIWENDIVKCNYNDYGEKGTYIGKVIFREDNCAFIVTDEKSTDYEWWNEEKEVIGNTFDNPDLLKGE